MKKSILFFLTIILMVIIFVFPIIPADASFKAYTILKHRSFNHLILTDGYNYFDVQYSYDCSFSSIYEGEVILIDSILDPAYGDDIVYDGTWGTDACTVSSFGNKLNMSSYTIEMVDSFDTIISDSFNYYNVDFSYECSFSNFSDVGKTILIDSSGYIGYGDLVIYNDYSTTVCETQSSNTLNLKEYTFIDSSSYDKYLIKDSYGTNYLIDPLSGCTSLYSMYEGEKIYIDLSGSLDGIGDTVYLFDDGQSCNLYDAEQVVDNYIAPTIPIAQDSITIPEPTPTLEPVTIPTPTPDPEPVATPTPEPTPTPDPEPVVENNEDPNKITGHISTTHFSVDMIYSGDRDNLQIFSGEKIMLKGRTLSNVKVIIYIESDPIVVETTSDTDGNWEYQIEDKLEVGEHTVSVEIENDDGVRSPKKEVSKFTVAANEIINNIKVIDPIEFTDDNSNINDVVLIALIIVVVISGFVGYFIYQKRKKKIIMDYKKEIFDQVKISDNIFISILKNAKLYYKKRPWIFVLQVIIVISSFFISPWFSLILGFLALLLPSWKEKFLK
ncbi:MAG: hypothetical protein Q8P20_10340 [bacterium]|nr:hypothetical protein [bacterium]